MKENIISLESVMQIITEENTTAEEAVVENDEVLQNNQKINIEYDNIDLYNGEMTDKKNLHEGSVSKVYVNKYERSKKARKICIKHHGCKCSICGISFIEEYGDLGKDYIHVHHLIPLNEIKEDYKVNPVYDMVPVCPNCHAMLHRKIDEKYLSRTELKKLWEDMRGR